MRDELIDTLDTLDIVDGVRESVTTGIGNSRGTGVGDIAVGRSEIVDCVGVSSDDGGEGSVAGEDGLTSEGGVARDTADSTTGEDGLTSEMGVMRDKEDSSDVTRVSLGRSCVVS